MSAASHSGRVAVTAGAPHPLSPSRVSATTALLSAWLLVFIAAVGGWMRRWMSDDGLIVLRTVRNLLAGNGPVFNAGERVEANTSTLWQYLIYLGGLIPGVRLERVATIESLFFTAAAMFIIARAAALLHRGRRGLIFVPLGGLVYIALPPARDFATSGLEWGLSIFWIAVWFYALVRWAQADTQKALLFAAFWSGLSWLVRPELALYGSLSGFLLLLYTAQWRRKTQVLAVALPLPLSYQIFRMGYYGLLTPHTAVAKSASEADWASGRAYVVDFVTPYLLPLGLVFVALAVAALLWWRQPLIPRGGRAALRRALAVRGRTRAVVCLTVIAALLHVLYVVRVGGDFMHGRMLLLPLFTLLAPVAIVPGVDLSIRQLTPNVVLSGVSAAVLGWSAVTLSNGTNHVEWEQFNIRPLGIVDEREFWTYITNRDRGDAPMYAEDFLTVDVVEDWADSVDEAMAEDDAQMIPFLASETEVGWLGMERGTATGDLDNLQTTAYFVNLGLAGMNTPLNMRILDTVGLATPLAARQPRMGHARVGHDKQLDSYWQTADTATDVDAIVPWISSEKVLEARAALRTSEMVELLESYRAPMTAQRFLSNIKFALSLGRSLHVPEDPADLLGEDVRQELQIRGDEASALQGPPEIAWPVDVRTDKRWPRAES